MSWLFLALSVGFFFMQDFRWALALPLTQYSIERGDLSATERIGPDNIRKLAERARADGDADGLSFAALNWPGDDAAEPLSLAQAAVIKDPSKGWLFYHIAKRYLNEHDSPALNTLAKAAVDFDDQNAVTYLLLAEIIRHRDKQFPWSLGKDPSTGRVAIEKLADKKDWITTMDAAFNSARYDTYTVQRFLLERKVLAREGWAQPAVLLLLAADRPIPNLVNVRDYANYRIQLSKDDDKDGKHNDEVMHTGYVVYHYGQLMENNAATTIEELIGRAVQDIAYQPLHDALRTAKLEDEVIALNLANQRAHNANSAYRDVLNRRSNSLWTGLVIMVSATLTAVFALLTLICFGYVNAKRWIRPDKQGRLFHLLTMAENYVPILLFLSSYTTFMFFVPYASNFRTYMAAEGDMRSIEPLFRNIYPLVGVDPYEATIIHPFGGYLYWVVVCFLAVGGAMLLQRFYSSETALPPEAEEPADEAKAASPEAGS
jgi:hypothetical protein